MQQTEIPIIAAIKTAEVAPPPMKCPFVVVAYWGAGGWWKISKQLWETPDCDGQLREVGTNYEM